MLAIDCASVSVKVERVAAQADGVVVVFPEIEVIGWERFNSGHGSSSFPGGKEPPCQSGIRARFDTEGSQGT